MTMDLASAARLFDVADCDEAVIATVERLLDTLQTARRARQQLASLPAGQLRAVLAYRAEHRTGS